MSNIFSQGPSDVSGIISISQMSRHTQRGPVSVRRLCVGDPCSWGRAEKSSVELVQPGSQLALRRRRAKITTPADRWGNHDSDLSNLSRFSQLVSASARTMTRVFPLLVHSPTEPLKQHSLKGRVSVSSVHSTVLVLM